MAITDHNERSHPSSSTDSQPTPTLGDRVTTEEPQDPRAAARAGIASAHRAVSRLLDDTCAYRQHHRNDANPDNAPIDTLVKTVHGLFSATYFLNRFAETLLHKPADG